MANQTTFIKLDRNILRWRWYKDSYTYHVFTYLITVANAYDEPFEDIVVRRGQRVTSYQTISNDTGISVKSVRTAIEHLKRSGEVASQRYPKYQVITVLNYDRYQGNRQGAGHPETSGSQNESFLVNNLEKRAGYWADNGQSQNGLNTWDCGDVSNSDGQSSGHSSGNQQAINGQQIKNNKNIKKGKKENNIPPLSPQGEDAFSDYAQEDKELLETLRAFEEMRNRIKSPMTPKAKMLLVKKLEKEAGHVRNKRKYKLECLNQSILQNWKTIYPVKEFADEGEEPALTPEEQALQEQLARMRR